MSRFALRSTSRRSQLTSRACSSDGARPALIVAIALIKSCLGSCWILSVMSEQREEESGSRTSTCRRKSASVSSSSSLRLTVSGFNKKSSRQNPSVCSSSSTSFDRHRQRIQCGDGFEAWTASYTKQMSIQIYDLGLEDIRVTLLRQRRLADVHLGLRLFCRCARFDRGDKGDPVVPPHRAQGEPLEGRLVRGILRCSHFAMPSRSSGTQLLDAPGYSRLFIERIKRYRAFGLSLSAKTFSDHLQGSCTCLIQVRLCASRPC